MRDFPWKIFETVEAREHLKQLLFIDASSMNRMGCNHNAADRAGTYDIFIHHLNSPVFKCHYNVTNERYEYEWSKHDPDKVPDLPNNEMWCANWTAREMEEYAVEYTKRFYDYEMKQREKNNSHQSAQDQGEQEIFIE